jgi:hypothetical protein
MTRFFLDCHRISIRLKNQNKTVNRKKCQKKEIEKETPFDPLKNVHQKPLPKQVLLSVPFTPQAPHANWNPPFDEACEEAALLMVEKYLSGEKLVADTAAEEIQKLVEWQKENGYPLDIPAKKVAEVAEQYFLRKAAVYSHDDVSVENIKHLLALGHPVILPAAGQLLQNPYFSGEGPPYHMLVIIGYKGDDFITNEPGTRRGEQYLYPQEKIISVIHDWTGSKQTIRSGKKAMVVIGR